MIQEDQAEKPWSLYVGLYTTIVRRVVAELSSLVLAATKSL